MEKAYSNITYQRTTILDGVLTVLRRFKCCLKAVIEGNQSMIYKDICSSDNVICSFCRPAESPASFDMGYCNFLSSYGPDGLNTALLDDCPCGKDLRDWLKGL